MCLFRRHFCDKYAYVKVKSAWKIPGTAPESFYTKESFGTVPLLPVPRLPPGGSLGTPKILGTGATLHWGPIRLHLENWECRALKSSARCQKFGVPCRFFSACKWGFRPRFQNVVLLPCRTQTNLARQWYDKRTAVVSNVEFNSVTPGIEELCFAEDHFKCQKATAAEW